MDCSTPGFPVHHQLSDFAQTHVHWVSDAIQTSHLLLPPSPLALNFPTIRVFSNESALRIRWPKFWCFSISPFNKYSGLISFRIDWFDLLAVQRTLKSLLRHHSLKAMILWHLAFFMDQLSQSNKYGSLYSKVPIYSLTSLFMASFPSSLSCCCCC